MVNTDFERIDKLRTLGYTWDEISEEGFTNTDRKMYYGWKHAQDDFENLTSKKLIDKVSKQMQNVRLAKKQLGIERSINNEQIIDISLRETFDDQMLRALENLPKVKLKKHTPIKTGNKEYMITLADLHYTGNDNEFDIIERAYNKILKLIEEKDIKKLHLVEFGDVIEGASLRTSQLKGIKKGMVKQTLEVAEAYVKLLEKLHQEIELVFYSVDSSNHTQLRNMGTRQNELIDEDLMLIFNEFIQRRLPTLTMKTGKDITIDLLGYKLYIAHGHLFKGENYINKLNAAKHINYDFYFFGHFHHFRAKDLNSNKTYDKRLFFVPALTEQETSYEEDRLLSSVSGIGYYEFEKDKGNILAQKITI